MSDLDARIVRLRVYGPSLTLREIADELGISESRVYSTMRRRGLQRQYRGLDKRTAKYDRYELTEAKPKEAQG